VIKGACKIRDAERADLLERVFENMLREITRQLRITDAELYTLLAVKLASFKREI
jgi:hypothetical protein